MTRFLEIARRDGLARRLSRLAKLDTVGATVVREGAENEGKPA